MIEYKRTRKMDEIKTGFEDQLARLGTDYLDIGTIHYVDAMDDWQMVLDAGILDYARKLKKQGHYQGDWSQQPQSESCAESRGKAAILMCCFFHKSLL